MVKTQHEDLTFCRRNQQINWSVCHCERICWGIESFVLPTLEKISTMFGPGPMARYWTQILQCSLRKPYIKEKQHFTTILVTNLETLVWFFPSLMLIWVLQSSQCSKIRVAQHWGGRGAHFSENKGEKSEYNKFSKKFKKNGFCFNGLWRVL